MMYFVSLLLKGMFLSGVPTVATNYTQLCVLALEGESEVSACVHHLQLS